MSTDQPDRSQHLVMAHQADDSTAPSTERYVFTPPIDIFETTDGLVLRADLPGVSLESLELQIQDNRLTLFGRVETVLPEDAVPLHREFEVGDFLRSFILSDEVDYDRITARLSRGVLEVELPRAEQPEPRRIQVNAD
tara:strand:- start:168 stop:581 length:414 start_codon:yes stop_codon:yes gene_type:complete